MGVTDVEARRAELKGRLEAVRARIADACAAAGRERGWEMLGVDPGELPSPVVAAGASLASFAVGAVIPLFPYLIGWNVLGVALGLAAVAAVIGGGVVARLTDRPFWRGAVRQLLLGAAAAAITYGIGAAVGHVAA